MDLGIDYYHHCIKIGYKTNQASSQWTQYFTRPRTEKSNLLVESFVKNINYQAKQVNQLSSKTRYMKDYGNTNMIANGLTQCQIVKLRSV